MKICPNCSTEFDNETLRFCTKDGTPLLVQSSGDDKFFTTLPSQASWNEESTRLTDYTEEATQIARPNQPTNQKIVIPMEEQQSPVAAPVNQPQQFQPAKKKSGMGIFAILGGLLVGIVALAGIGGGAWWYLSRPNSHAGNTNSNLVNTNSNANVNTNTNTDSNSIFGFPGDSNSNSGNINGNSNISVNANFVTPKPTPTKTPTPKPSPTKTPIVTNSNASVNANVNVSNSNNATNANVVNTPKPTPSPTPNVVSTPIPTPTPKPSTPQTVAGGVLNSRAASLPKPAYPQAARALNISGSVTVAVTVDENGNVVSAKAISGNPLLRGAAEAAARQSKFKPANVDGQPVKVNGSIVYNFVP